MKADWFNGWIAKSAAQLQDSLIGALQAMMGKPAILQSQCRPKTSL